jgi:hypothetical protein
LTREQKQKIACTLRQEGWTQDRIAQMLGIGQTTASRWLGECSQTGKPTQPSEIRGKDGRAYPPTRAPKSAKPQTEKTDTAEHGSTSPTPPGNSIDTGIDAELAEGMQHQGAVPGWSITPDGPSSEDVSVEPEATDFPNASSPGNSSTLGAVSETAASPMGSLPAP